MVPTTEKLHNNYQKRAKEAEAALEHLNKLIGTILNAGVKEHEMLWCDQNIRLHGKPSMKHKMLVLFWEIPKNIYD